VFRIYRFCQESVPIVQPVRQWRLWTEQEELQDPDHVLKESGKLVKVPGDGEIKPNPVIMSLISCICMSVLAWPAALLQMAPDWSD
jgi:hypothetical protein